jgi:hypothetical protein
VNTAYRKTSLHRDKPNLELAVSELADPGPQSPRPVLVNEREHAWEGTWMTRIIIRVVGISLLHDVKKTAAQRRGEAVLLLLGRDFQSPRGLACDFKSSAQILGLVEPDGIEPTTSCLQSRRSPN